MTYKIEDGIAITSKRKGKGFLPTYPFREMEPGQSFFVPLSFQKSLVSLQSSLLGNAKHHFGTTKQVTTRMVSENGVQGVRVWRVKQEGEKP